ncbi:NRPS-like enzyme [Fusarium beomiforme]|uniref:NRPS-like enzyme n=1 Tax=Fusarium beomiforme TaxID=44412 RepID=A0A9P5ADN2_9HYPO|nr:NRPS-like enzyme [Fusarium beomiforme]
MVHYFPSSNNELGEISEAFQPERWLGHPDYLTFTFGASFELYAIAMLDDNLLTDVEDLTSLLLTPRNALTEENENGMANPTIDELVRLKAERNKDHVAVIESPLGDQGPQSYTSKQIDDLAFQLACVYSEKYNLKPRNSSHQTPDVVAISGIGDFEYLITLLAIAKLGRATLLLSPRLPYESCDALLRISKASLLLVQGAQKPLAEHLRSDTLDRSAGFILPIDHRTSVCNTKNKPDTNLTPGLDLEVEKKSTIWILRSSGSTGLTKLVSLLNEIALHRPETGTLLSSLRAAEDNEWSWLRAPPEIGHPLRFEHQGSDTYELVCLKEWPMLAGANQDDGSWRTKDLFIKQPTMPGAFKYAGRLDDIVVLENGEKFNPISVENKISSSPLVDGCVIFGTGKPAAGIAVIPSKSTASMVTEEIRPLLWSVIEKAQDSLPMYGPLTEDLMLLLPKNSAVPRTDKNTIIRSKFLTAFEKEIQAIYDKEESTMGTKVYSDDELLQFLSKKLVQVLHLSPTTELSHGQDFSTIGLDSLRAMQLRAAILRHIDLGGNTLGINVIWPNYCLDWCDWLSRSTSTVKAVPLFLYSKGYSLLRASSNETAQRRVEQVLKARCLRSKFPAERPEKITCLAADLSDRYLGFGGETLHSIASEVDIVYHCGWAVNFNQRLSTFEKSCIAGVRHLIDLCLAGNRTTPARFIFFSSISAIIGTSEATIPERLPKFLTEASRTGYSRSKYVAEQICAKASEKVGLPVGMVRIGQIVGGTVHCIWNTSEAVPLMIRSAQTIGALPTLQARVRWLPIDEVAQIVLEIGSSDAIVASKTSVFNIVNLHTLRWTEDLLPLLTEGGLSFQAVRPSEWIERLEESDPNPGTNLPRKLLEYFKEQCRLRDTVKDREWETSRTAEWSLTFHNATAPSLQLISVILEYFKGAWKM